VTVSWPQKIFDETFLTIRSKLIDVAATLDRVDRAAGGAAINDPRRARIDEALRIVMSSDSPDRAKRLQQLFSRPYDSQWRREFGL